MSQTLKVIADKAVGDPDGIAIITISSVDRRSEEGE